MRKARQPAVKSVAPRKSARPWPSSSEKSSMSTEQGGPTSAPSLSHSQTTGVNSFGSTSSRIQELTRRVNELAASSNDTLPSISHLEEGNVMQSFKTLSGDLERRMEKHEARIKLSKRTSATIQYANRETYKLYPIQSKFPIFPDQHR